MDIYHRAVPIGFSFGLGWHGHDGCIYDRMDYYFRSDAPLKRLPTWARGSKDLDTVGLGLDRETGNVFFTKNGELVGIVGIKIKGRYIPAFSAPSDCVPRINLGGEPFQFKGWEDPIDDIEKLAKASGSMTDWEEEEEEEEEEEDTYFM